MRLGDLLLSSKTIDASVLQKALAHGAQVQRPLQNVLVAYNVVEARRIARLLSRALKLDVTDVTAVTIHPRVLELIPRHAAERFRVLPIGVKPFADGNRLYLAMSDPTDIETVGTIAAAVGLPVEPMLCDDAVLQRAFDVQYAVRSTTDTPSTPPVHDTPGFLTESTPDTVDALEHGRAYAAAGAGRSGDPRRGAVAAALGLEPTGSQPLPPPSVVGAPVETAPFETPPVATVLGPPIEPAGSPPRSWAPAGVVFGAVADLPPDDGSDPFAGESLPPDAAAWAASQEGGPVTVTEAPSAWTTPSPPVSVPSLPTPPPSNAPIASVASVSRLIVSTTVAGAVLRELLWERVGPVEVIADVGAACAAAATQPAVVLVEPPSGNDLIRALLELTDLEVKPRVVIVGGDPSLRLMGGVDLQVEAPARRGDLVDVILGALRQVGIAP